MDVASDEGHAIGTYARPVRSVLIASGGVVTLLVLAAGPLGMHRGATIGPTEIQVLLVGFLLVAAGVLPAPVRVVSRIVHRARAPIVSESITGAVKRKLTAIVVLALLVRVWMVATYWPSAQMVMGMALWDAEMARNLLQGRGWVLNQDFVRKVDHAIVERDRMVDPQDYLPADDSRPGALTTFPNYAHTPGYSLWLAASFVLGRAQRFVYSQWMQCALDALACLLVFGIGRRLWSTTAGVIGALAYALSPAHMYVAMQTFAAATDSFWVLLVGYGIVRTWRDYAARRSVVPGVTCVVAGSFAGTMMNSTALVLPVVAAMWAVVVGVASKPAWRMVSTLVVAQFIVLALITPWALRNRAVYGHFTFARQTFWQMAWETLGQIPNPWGLELGKDDAPYVRWVAARCPGPCPGDRREAITRDYLVSNVLFSRALPAHLVRLVAARLPGLVYVSRLPADKPYPPNAPLSAIARPVLAVLNGFALLLFPAAAFGLILVTVRGGETATAAWLGLAPSLFAIAFSLAVFVEHRKTTEGYGYALALGGVAVAASVDSRAKDH